MADPFKSIITLGEAKRAAKFSDLAARAMARHCDKRIADMKAVLRNARASLVAFGGDPSGIRTKREARRLGVDVTQWELLKEIDAVLGAQG